MQGLKVQVKRDWLWVWLCISLLAAVPQSRAQSTETKRQLELAREYTRREDWPKAIETYKPLTREGALLGQIYAPYLEALQKAGQREEALRYARKVWQATDQAVPYGARYHLLLLEGGPSKDGDRLGRDLLDQARDQSRAMALYNFYLAQGRPALAEGALLKARILSGDGVSYAYELAGLYRQQGRQDKMLDELFALADRDPTTLQEVQGLLQDALEKKEQVDLFEQRLIAKLSQQPDNQTYANLLYWLYVQQKDFDGAMVQAKALDRRAGGRGGYPVRLLEVAQLARSAGAYEKADEVYDYISQQYAGQAAGYAAAKARTELADERLRGSYPLDLALARKLAGQYRGLLKGSENKPEATEILRHLAAIEGPVLGHTDTAVTLLELAITKGRYNPEQQARAKLDLGDLYLIRGEPWEGTLLYSQVEKDAKDQPLGHEAKLRNARLSFFRGEFGLSQEHLDVLKQATSREIANDAMQLSLMIKDNLVFDTTGAGLKVYSRAELALMRSDYDLALKTLDSIPALFAGHSLLDDVLWRKAQVYRQTRRYPEAVTTLQQLLDKHPDGIYGDDALYGLANIYDLAQPDPIQAMRLYERLLKDYPGSIYVVESRKRFRALRGDKVN